MAEKIAHVSVEEAAGRSCRELWGPRSVLTEIVENTLKGRSYSNFEAGVSFEVRERLPLSISTTTLKDGKGNIVGALVVISDLSEVKELEGKVRQADKLTALGTMAAGMAHEIKNPLSSMKVLSQLMEKKFEDAEFRRKFTDIMPREIGRIDRIVESLLGFARATTPRFEPVSVSAVLDEALKLLEEQIKSAEVKVIREYADLPLITADQQQLMQVFLNLLLNALQAMPEGGELRVVTRPKKIEEGWIKSVSIEITDTGHGIPAEHLNALFDPFFTTKHGGTGLGLTIAHSIIDSHQGTIEVRSAKGKGSTFTIVLPVEQGE
jgi:signal transduction histidine kinase